MITGKLRHELSEKQYRALERDSSSSVKDFYDSPQKYYKKYILGEAVEEEEEDKASLVGSLVHTLLLENKESFDRKYYTSTCPEKPTEKMLDFCNALIRHTMDCMDADGVVQEEMTVLMERAYRDSGYSISLSTVVSKFKDKIPEQYYMELRNTRPKNLIVVTVSDMTNAERIVAELRSHPFYADLVNMTSDWKYKVFNELKIDEYEVDGLPLKSMLDKVIANTQKKTLQIVDFKVTWNVVDFYNAYYLKRRSFIQAYLYTKALESVKEELGFEDYEVLPPKFLVCDSIGFCEPLLYELTEDDLYDAYHGFTTATGRHYRGVKQVIEELLWSKETDNWRMTREAFFKQGRVPLK